VKLSPKKQEEKRERERERERLREIERKRENHSSSFPSVTHTEHTFTPWFKGARQ
jgi:hypothetical protein